MNLEPIHDSTTLKNCTTKEPGSFLLLNPRPGKLVTEPVKPSALLERICSFIPKIAAANDSLMQGEVDKVKELEVDIHKVPFDLDESDTSSSDEDSCSDESIDSETLFTELQECGRKVEFDLALFREVESAAPAAASEFSLTRQEVELLPEAFRECESSECTDHSANKSKKLIEEL